MRGMNSRDLTPYWIPESPENVRPEVLKACYDVFEEDREIFDDLRES